MEHRREQALRRRQGGAAAGAVSRRDQRQPARGVVRRVVDAFDEEAGTAHAAGAVSPPIAAYRSMPVVTACRFGSGRWSFTRRGNGAPAGWRAICTSSSGSTSSCARPGAGSREGTSWRAHRADAGVLSADRSGQRMAAAPAMVRAERDGRSSRGRTTSLVEKNALYRCLDKLVEHKQALFSHLRQRWQDLFGAQFEVCCTTSRAPTSSRAARGRRRTSVATATAATSAATACRW